MTSKALPNDPCPCGSGKKFKRCCAIDDQTALAHRRRNRILRTSAVVGGLIGLVLIFSFNTIASQRGNSSATVPGTVIPPRANVPVMPPAGAAPAGKVWSSEHGHWHDAPPAAASAPGAITPPPAGAPPPGKVWSSEHGHWHDAPAAAAPAGNTPQPAGETPEGKVWSAEHGHWHDEAGGPDQ